mmetsp:Transcript_46640/g.113648  ORF Transcript_46640/g.113648 Transcript_46640/m.113648 type:complete len:491 (+) Transcript_46640:103-1575(+)
MPLSAYDIFMRIDDGLVDPSSSSSGEDENHGSSSLADSDSGSSLPPSSHPSTSSSSLSLSLNDSDFLSSSQGSDGGIISISSRLQQESTTASTDDEMTNQRTILSSRSGSSGATIPVPDGVVMMATPPHFYSGQISLSTAETQSLPCEAFQDDDDEDDDEEGSEMDLIATDSSDSDGSDLESLQHYDSTNDMSLSLNTIECQDKTWYDRLVSESDWEEFRLGAHSVLKAILQPGSEKYENKLLPLPPSPPTPDMLLFSSTDRPCVPYSAKDHVAPEFVCQICNDVMVGAIKLECDCPSAMVCASCWGEDGLENDVVERQVKEEEQKDGSLKRSPEYAERMDFVWVENSKQCPCCNKRVGSTTTCHALDVAILHIVTDLAESSESSPLSGDKGKIASLKQTYYARLAAWRAAVYEKNEIRCRREAARHDELLARLIQEEERVIWRKGAAARRGAKEAAYAGPNNAVVFLGQAAIALLAATITSIGINSLSR